MALPTIHGVIRRRILVNYRVDPERMQRPAVLGMSSENAAHRVAVQWTTPNGEQREGVYIPRRDSNSIVNHLAGGRLFPGEHHRAQFSVVDHEGAIERVHSSFFADPKLFPQGSVEFDCALVMRDIEHEWQRVPDLPKGRH